MRGDLTGGAGKVRQARAGLGPCTEGRAGTGRTGPGGTDETVARAAALLGRTVQRHRVYPAASPLCQGSVSECRSALEGLSAETLELRVTPRELFHGSDSLPGTAPLSELAERLFRADVEVLRVQRETPPKELGRFCRQLATWDRRGQRDGSFAEVLDEQGVSSITARAADKLEVLEIGVVSAERLARLSEERSARAPEDQLGEAQGRHQAWIQVDTDCDVESIDLVDLAFLVDNQADLAQVLYDIAEGGPQSASSGEALRESIAELVELYSSLSPRVAEQRFAGLARTLMTLDTETRHALTRDVLMPDLLETGRTARLLQLLPDGEVVEAVRTLAELEVGAPGLVKLAFDRLALPDERRATLARAVGESLVGEGAAGTADSSSAVRLSADGSGGRDFREYTAHELSVDDRTAAELDRIKAAFEEADRVTEWLRCCANLVRHLRNPDHAEEMLERAAETLISLIEADAERAARSVDELRAAADEVREHRPEVAEAVDGLMLSVCSPSFLRVLAEDWAEQGGPDPAGQALLIALGTASMEALVRFFEEESSRAIRRRIMDFMCDNADAFADASVPYLSDERWTVVRNMVLVIGHAGPGREADLAPLVGHREDRVAREALLALARIGSAEAAELVLSRLVEEDPSRLAMAEESIRTFPVEEGRRQTRRLLADRRFLRRSPKLARGLVERFVPKDAAGWEEVLSPILPLRFRFWSPKQMALGRAAAAALKGRRE